jgi:hypothetical protein
MKRIALFLAALAVATGASAGMKRIDYAAYTGDPVREVRYTQLYNWQRSTDKAVVLWTRPSNAYMLTLAHTCDPLRGGRVVIQVGGVASVPGVLRPGDDLIVGPIQCRVTEIRPIDLAAIKADRKR